MRGSLCGHAAVYQRLPGWPHDRFAVSAGGRETRREAGDELLRAARELPVRDANDALSGELQLRVLEPIALEGSAGRVVGPAVELDDESVLGPVDVDLV